jgi:excisionase family DNA binding protein
VSPADVLTVEQAAELLRVGRNQMYEAIGRGEVPHVRIGRTIRLSRRALEEWLLRGSSA